MKWKKRKPLKEQGDFLTRLGEMLENGFSISEAIEFYSRLDSRSRLVTENIVEELHNGVPIHEILFHEHFDHNACIQIFFADKHGYMSEALKGAGEYLRKKANDRKTVMKLLQYPLILITILFFVMALLKNLLLPQFNNLYQSMGYNSSRNIHVLIDFIKYTPKYLLLFTLFILVCLFITHLYFRNKSPIDKADWLSRIPIFQFYYKLYISQFLAREWSFLLKSGFSINEVLRYMMNQSFRPLLRDTAEAVMNRLKLGEPFSVILSDFRYIEKEFTMVVKHGEKNGRLDHELLYYSQFSFVRMEEKIQKIFRGLQPAIFIVIGLMIVAVYISILYPMFQMIDAV